MPTQRQPPTCTPTAQTSRRPRRQRPPCPAAPPPPPTTALAAGVTVASSFASLSCNSFSVITVTVRDGGGNPLPNVTLNVAASIGSARPTPGGTRRRGAAP